MKVLIKERLLNWKKLLLFFILLVALFISYIFISGLFELMFQFDVNAPDLVGKGEQVKQAMIFDRLNIHDFMYTVTCMVQIAPIIIFSYSIFFFQEKKSVFLQKYVRGHSQKKVIISSLLNHSLYVAAGFYLVYIIYLTIGWHALRIEPSQVPLNVFDGVFGSNFSKNNLYLYFIISGFYKAFMAAFTYSLLSCSICLIVQKAYQSILYSSIYYYGLTLLFSVLPLNRDLFHCVQPAMIQGFTEYVYVPPTLFYAIAPLLTLVIPFLISFCIVIYTLKRSEKLEY